MATQSGPAHGAPAHAFPLAGVTDAPPRTTLALIAALGLTALLAPAAAADDDDLPIALGDVVAGSLDVTTEVDRFTFTAPAGQVVYLDRIDTDNPFGLNWSLQDAHGRALLGSTTQLPDLGPVTLMGGEYSVVISGEQHQVGTYEFAVRDATPDALVLPLDTEVGDEISQPGQIDRWTYTASPGEQVVLDFLTSSNANNLDWRLVDSRGRELLPPGSSIRDEGPFTLLGGEHVLEVRGENGTDAVGTYEFALRPVPPGTAAGVSLGATVSDDIAVWGERDRFQFSATSGDRLSLDVLSTSNVSGLNLTLRDAFGRVLFGPTTQLSDQAPVTLMGGDYELEITAERGQAGSYTLHLGHPSADTDELIVIGDTVLDAIDTYGEMDTWRFVAAPGQVVSLDLVGAGTITGLNWELLDEAGRALLPKTTLLRDEHPIALMGGEYRLRVTAENGQSGAYQFTLHDVVASDTALALDASMSASLDVPGEVDRYHFTAPPGQVVFLDQIGTSNPFGLGLNWKLEDALGRQVLSQTGSFGDQGPFTLMGGDYVLSILGELGITADYEFMVVDQGLDLSWVPGAPTHAVGDVIAANLSAPGATDSYSFDVTHGQRLLLDITVSSTALTWRLRDPVGQPVFGPSSLLSPASDQGPFDLAAGTYTLEMIANGSGTPAYALQIVEVVDGGGPLTPDTPLADALATGGAVNDYALSLSDETTLFLDLTSTDGNLSWTLLDPAGQPVFGTTDANNVNNHDQGPFPLRAGSYQLRVDGSGGATPAFGFTLHAVQADAAPLAVGTPVAGGFAQPGDSAAFDIAVTDGQHLVFDLQQGNNSLRWELLDPVGQPVFASTTASSANNGDQGPFDLAAGTYRLTLDPINDDTPDWAFQVWEVADVETPLAFESDLTDTSSAPWQRFRFPFTLGDDDTRLFFDGQFGVNNMVWTLFDEHGQAVFGPGEFHGGGADQGPLGLLAGDYELVVENKFVLDGTFGLSVHVVADGQQPLPLGSEVLGSVPGPGSAEIYDFTAAAGQRLMFEVTQSSSQVLWTLQDEHGESGGLIEDANANNPGSQDKGPFELAAGAYRLSVRGDDQHTPDFGFRVRNVDQDLLPQDIHLSPAVFADGETGRQTDVTWRVRNLGGPDDLLGSWTDRLVLSNDANLGDADDLLLGEFVVMGPLASLDTYERTETLLLPDETALGDYRIFLLVDAFDQLDEAGGEDNNALAVTLSIVPPADLDAGCIEFDQIDGAGYPAGSVVALSGRARTLEGSVNVVYVLDTSTSTQQVCGLDSNFDGVLDALDDLNGDDGSTAQPSGCEYGTILDSEIGATLLLDAFLGQSASTSHAVVVFSDGAAPADLGPESGKQEWVAPWDRDQDGDGALDLDTALRSLWSTGFLACALGTGIREFTQYNVGCGTDFRNAHLESHAALLGAGPAGRNLIVFLSDGEATPTTAIPTPAELEALAALGVDFRGYQLGGNLVTPSLQYLADGFEAHPLSQGSARSVLDLDDLLFELVQSISVIAVTVNGAQVDSLDATGRFFHTVSIQPGPNVFVVEAIDSDGMPCTSTLTLHGLTAGDGAYQDLSVVTTSLDTDWTNSTVNHFDDTYVVSARATHTGDTLLRGPLLMVVDGPGDPLMSVANPDGYAPDGRPYFTFLDTTVAAELEPGESTPTRTLRFANPEQMGVEFDFEWLALGNAAPFFTSAPPLEAVVDAPWSYLAQAGDPDGHALTYALTAGPAGLALDPVTGQLDWTPSSADIGAHGVTLAGADGWGGHASQTFTLVVSAEAVNHPPHFTSTPGTQASIGAAYTYAAGAVDPDGDALTFARLLGPADLTVSAAGLVSWPFALPGSHPVAVSVSDPSGASAEQSWTLVVGQVSSGLLPPLVLGSPSGTASVGSLYFYAPAVDSVAAVSFSLTTAPAGMTVDAADGRVLWTPLAADVGNHPVVLRADNGSGAAVQSWTVQVHPEPVNQPPVITSTPSLLAFVDEPWSYDAQALDPEGAPLTWSLVTPPAGMTIAPASGLVQWTPAVAPDSVSVGVRATDVEGATGTQVFTLPVHPTNTPPEFTSAPVTAALVGGSYLYDAQATDADGHVPTFQLVSGPVGMFVNPVTGVVAWTPTQADLGAVPVTIRVSDGFLGSDEQSWVLDVAADVTAPLVSVFVSVSPATAHQPVQVCVQASDDGTLASRMLTADGVEVLLDAAGCAFVTPSMPGAIALVGTAVDSAGNIGMDSRILAVGPDAESPLVEVISPAPGSILTKPEDLVASSSDDNPAALSWSVDIRRGGSDVSEAVELASGTGPVSAGVLTRFDPTVLPNDTWLVRILADDGVTLAGVEYAYELSGNLKAPHFTVSFDDLVTYLAGVPIVLTRHYSSLDTSPGDFGPGWRLGFYGDVDDGPVEIDSDQPLVQLLGDEPFRQGSRVYVTRPDGTRVGFTFEGHQLGFPTPQYWSANFVPDPGVTDTLEALDLEPVLTHVGGLFFAFVIPYNPELYRLTTQTGVAYVIHERDGLQSIEDVAGNVIAVTPDGLFSDTGEAILFERNAAGSITRIVEPGSPADGGAPGELSYLYDPVTGALTAALDQLDNATSFHYDQPGLPHYLSEVRDPLDRPLVRTVYDDDGVLLAYCNGDADIVSLEGCVEFDTDMDLALQTVTTAKGHRIDFVFDERGNVLQEIRHLEGGGLRQIVRSFDADDNVLSETDPAGNTTTFTWDDRGNMLSRSDPAGRTWTFTYDDDNRLLLACDPLGDCTASVYDADGLKITERLADGSERHWDHDQYGRQVSFTDATGNVWTAAYLDVTDGEDVTDPDLPVGQVAFTQYGASQEVLFTVDRDGRRIDYAYDDAHRMVSETWDDGTVIGFTHDAAGQVTAITAPDSVLTMQFSAVGMTTRVDNLGTPGAPHVALDYTHDAHQLVTSVADSLGGLTTYAYDELDRLTSVRQQTVASPLRSSGGSATSGPVTPVAFGGGFGGAGSGSGPAGGGPATFVGPSPLSLGAVPAGPRGLQPGVSSLERRVDFVWNDADLLSEMHRFADLAGTLGVTDTYLDYDCGGCASSLVQLHHRRAADAGVVHDIDLVRDAGGHIISVTDAEGSHGYLHDGRGRLLSAQHVPGAQQPDEVYDLDGEGNRVASHLAASPVYSYQLGLGGSRLLSDDGFSYEYDAEGRLTRRENLFSGHSSSYAWDHRGRLVEVVLRDAGDVELDRAAYVYDGLDRRIRSTESGVTRHIVHDGRNPILVLDDAGVVLERRLYGRELDQILADEVGGANRWYHLDQVGSVRDLTDDAGHVLGHFVYDSYGRVLDAPTDPAGDTVLRFQSRETSPLTGLVDFRARWYDPGTGRFLSLDPVLPLQYVGFENAPHRLTDPLGLTAAISYACLAVAAYNNAVLITKVTVMVWKHWTPKALAGLTGGPGTELPGFPDIPPAPALLIKGLCNVTGSAFPGAK